MHKKRAYSFITADVHKKRAYSAVFKVTKTSTFCQLSGMLIETYGV